jgi:hypothetical protein
MVPTFDFYETFKRWWVDQHGEKNPVPSPTNVGLNLANLPHSRIAQNKDKFKRADGTRFYLGGYLNTEGGLFWDDARRDASLSGRSSRLADDLKHTKEPIPPKWKETEEYRRIVANTERIKEQRSGNVDAANAAAATTAGTITAGTTTAGTTTAGTDGLDIPEFLRRA